MARKVRYLRIRGRIWSIENAASWKGLCVHKGGGRTIILNPKEHKTDVDFMDTTIHEVLHAQHPKWTERQVAARANEIAQALWLVGFAR